MATFRGGQPVSPGVYQKVGGSETITVSGSPGSKQKLPGEYKDYWKQTKSFF